MMDEEYFRFRVEKDKNDWFNIAVKSLIILVLLIAIILLLIWGYRYLTKPSINYVKQNNIQTQQQVRVAQQTNVQTQQARTFKKEELALIIKLVLEEMQKEQKNLVKKAQTTKNKSEDSELLNSLQNIKEVDTTKEIKQKTKTQNSKKIEKLANKKIKDQIIKKKITYNAVVINQKEIKSVNDLARLYASINKISRKQKKKILKSAYAKKITKEIIIRKNAMRTIKVRPGDTLSSIAQRAYGKSSMYNKIFEANPDLLSDPNRLKVGMILRVPK